MNHSSRDTRLRRHPVPFPARAPFAGLTEPALFAGEVIAEGLFATGRLAAGAAAAVRRLRLRKAPRR